jgi:hypothetical protein
MLELEKKTLHISIKKPVAFINRPLIRALLWSALIHLCLLCSFRIKMISFHESDYPLKPIAVAIEEEIAPVITAAVETESIIPQVAVNWDEVRQDIPTAYVKISKAPMIETYDTISSEQTIASLPNSLAHHAAAYPLRIKFSPNLRQLKLLADGSSLFRQKESEFLLSPLRFPITYTVSVNGQTGKVIRWTREGILADKTLQSCADTLLSTLRFVPFGSKTIEGTICFIFRCNGQELQQLLKDKA